MFCKNIIVFTKICVKCFYFMVRWEGGHNMVQIRDSNILRCFRIVFSLAFVHL